MKKLIITILILLPFIVGAFTGVTYGATGLTHKATKAGVKFYYGGDYVGKVKTSKRLAVKVVKSEKLTAHTLEHRKNKYVLVEVVKGKCVNDNGDGRTSDGYYISYKRVKGHKRGAKYTTYCIYANNNYIDDVAFRVDIRR